MHKYYLFHKPYQVLTQFSPEAGKRTLADYISHIPSNAYPVGRLDYDSEGLLLITNDKDLSYRLLEPRFRHARTYLAQVENIPAPSAIQQLEKSIVINNKGKSYTTLPAKAKLLEHQPAFIQERNPPIRYRKEIPAAWLQLILCEGKNRQVRKMTAAVGCPTLRLIRYAIGAITVEDIAVGEIVEADARIKQELLRTIGK